MPLLPSFASRTMAHKDNVQKWNPFHSPSDGKFTGKDGAETEEQKSHASAFSGLIAKAKEHFDAAHQARQDKMQDQIDAVFGKGKYAGKGPQISAEGDYKPLDKIKPAVGDGYDERRMAMAEGIVKAEK